MEYPPYNITDTMLDYVSKIMKKIIKLIKENPDITQIEMAKKLGITRDGISYNIRILKENRIIKRIGSTKKGRWGILK